MTDGELASIVARLRRQRSDDAQTEAKACAGGLSTDVWESVSAFGNTHGGLIILGLDENARFTPAKGFELEKVRNAFVEGMGDGAAHSTKITNIPAYEMERVFFEGKQLLCITIHELAPGEKPAFVTRKGRVGGSYKRIDDKDIRLSANEVYELSNLLQYVQSDRAAVPEASTNDLSSDLLDRFIEYKRSQGARALRGATDRTTQLKRLNVINESGAVRLAGLLAFGNYPQQFFPKLLIDVAVFPTERKSAPGEVRFLDRVLCEGTFEEMLDDAMRSIAKNLRTISYVEGPGRRDELEIPEVVLREALTNALVHREYAPQFLGQAVSVEIYPDRVEILNPGGLWGGKTTSTLADGTSRCRNDTLMSLVSSLPPQYGPFPGSPAEGQGSGIPLMIREMEQRGIDRPLFEAGLDSFRVILSRGGGVVLPKPHGSGSGEGPAVRIRARRSTQETREAIVQVFGADAGLELGMRDLADRLGTSHGVMRERLKELVDAGVLEPTAPPTSTNRKYRLRN